jgi:Zn-finger domain-containing protein
LSGGNFTGDGLSEELIDNLKELERVLAAVKDETSARRASPRIESILQRQAKLRKAILDLAGTLSGDEDRQLKARYGEQIESAARRVIVELQRIKESPGTQPALKAIVDPESDSS